MEDLDPEELVVCPYESAHLIRVKRMQVHIYECRKSHASTDIGKCPFNASHVVYEAERRWHMMTCPDRHQVHSKILQEMMSDTENRGCVETPAYRPVTMFGDSWEAPEETNQTRQQHWSPSSENASAAPVKTSSPQAAKKELNPRQRRQLYLKKLAEEEERKKKAQGAEASSGLPFRLQNSGDSQSLARFQQQTGKDVESNIYRDTLKEPHVLTAIGRGHSGLSGRGSPPTVPSGSLPRIQEPGARSIADNMQSPVSAPGSRQITPSFMSSVGRGGNSSDENMPMMVDDRARVDGDVDALSVAGRGITMGTETFPSDLGAGGDLWLGGYSSQGVMPSPFRALGMGKGSVSAMHTSPQSREVPFGRMTSQPDGLAPALHHMKLARGRGRGAGRGCTTIGLRSGDLEDDQVTNRRDPGRYMDTEPLVRGDYGQGPGDPGPAQSPAPSPSQGSPQCRPTKSSSSMSLGSNPGAVECWAEEMDKVEDGSPATVSESDETGLGGMEMQVRSKLKKMEKKLREIARLEARKNSGETLDVHQEQKLQKKAEYENEASLLRNLLTID